MTEHEERPWTEQEAAKLIEMWHAGTFTAEISQRLGRSVSSIVSKRKRLRLPERGNPIKRRDVPKAPRPPSIPRAPAQTLPVLAAITEMPPVVAAKPKPKPKPKKKPKLIVVRPCCYPIGEPGNKSFRYCGEQIEAGKPYCTEHCNIAYARRAA